jgi:hypothetical protein
MEVGPFQGTGIDLKGSLLSGIYRCAAGMCACFLISALASSASCCSLALSLYVDSMTARQHRQGASPALPLPVLQSS